MCLYPGSGGFYCFGCHAHGDAIALYGKALNLTNLEAARQVCRDFGFQYDEGKRRKRAPSPLSDRRREARALAKRLEAMREKQADGLLERMRSAQEIIMQMASSKANGTPCWIVEHRPHFRSLLSFSNFQLNGQANAFGKNLSPFSRHIEH